MITFLQVITFFLPHLFIFLPRSHISLDMALNLPWLQIPSHDLLHTETNAATFVGPGRTRTRDIVPHGSGIHTLIHSATNASIVV